MINSVTSNHKQSNDKQCYLKGTFGSGFVDLQLFTLLLQLPLVRIAGRHRSPRQWRQCAWGLTGGGVHQWTIQLKLDKPNSNNEEDHEYSKDMNNGPVQYSDYPIIKWPVIQAMTWITDSKFNTHDKMFTCRKDIYINCISLHALRVRAKHDVIVIIN